jgi:hypothetical protein
MLQDGLAGVTPTDAVLTGLLHVIEGVTAEEEATSGNM